MLGARRLLAQSGSRYADVMGELECDGASACGNGEDTQENRNQGVVSDRTRAQIASVEKEESRATTRKVRAELALSRNLEKEKSIETREASGQDQGECRDGESSQENAEQAFQLEINCKRRKPRICSHKILPRPLLNEETEIRERLTESNHSRCFATISSRMFGIAGEVAVVDVLEHGFPRRLVVFVDGVGSESEERVDGLTPIICDERVAGLTHKIDGERVERLTRIIREERVDELTIKIDGERFERLTCKNREERVDGLIKIFN